MDTPAQNERRKERRYIVSDMEARLDGTPVPIVDISCSAVRVVRPADFAVRDRAYDLLFALERDGSMTMYRVVGTIVRHTDMCVVLHYPEPVEGWEDVLKAFDCFETTQLFEL